MNTIVTFCTCIFMKPMVKYKLEQMLYKLEHLLYFPIHIGMSLLNHIFIISADEICISFPVGKMAQNAYPDKATVTKKNLRFSQVLFLCFISYFCFACALCRFWRNDAFRRFPEQRTNIPIPPDTVPPPRIFHREKQ